MTEKELTFLELRDVIEEIEPDVVADALATVLEVAHAAVLKADPRGGHGAGIIALGTALAEAVQSAFACDICGEPGPRGMCQATVSPATLFEPAEACDRCAHGTDRCVEHGEDIWEQADRLRDERKYDDD